MDEQLNPQPVTQQPLQPEIKPVLSNKLIYILGSVFIIATIAMGAYIFMNSKQEKKEAKVAATAPTITPDPTADWKTYTSNNLKYQISYPEDPDYQKSFPESNQLTEYSSTTTQPSLLGGSNIDLVLEKTSGISSVGISVWKNLGVKITDITTRDEWCKKLQPELQGQQQCQHDSISETEFNNSKAFKGGGVRDNSSVEIYYVPYGNYVYKISIFRPMQDIDNSLPGKVLSTFKFIDQTSSMDTSSWKTHTEFANKFSLEYPPSWSVNAPPSSCERCTFSAKGTEGVITIEWAPIAAWNGNIDENFTTPKVTLKNEVIDSINYKLKDGSESWTILKDFYPNGSAFRISAIANNPATTNRELILKIFSTFQFLN